MEASTTLNLLVIFMVVIMLYPKAESQWIPRRPLPRVSLPDPDPKEPGDLTLPPLCASQFALVNRACALLPYTPLPPPSPPAPSPAPDDDSPSTSKHHGHGHGHGHGHRHGHGHGHGHGHRHRMHGEEEGTDVEKECCRWLKEVDNECVCGIVVRLPPFLTRPVHNYTVVVDDVCQVSFACGSRIVPL